MAEKGGKPFCDTKLSPALVKELSQRNALGEGYRSLQDWVEREHKIAVSHITIRNKIIKYREEHEEIANMILEEKTAQIREAVTDDLDIMQKEIDALYAMVAALGTSKKNNRERLQISDRIAKWVDLRRKYCGVKSAEEKALDDKPKVHSQELMSRLDDLIQRRQDTLTTNDKSETTEVSNTLNFNALLLPEIKNN